VRGLREVNEAMLWTLAILLSSLLLFPGCFKAISEIEADARGFAAAMGPDKVTGVSCVDRDSDRDGYVTCTVFRQGKEPLAIECTCIEGNHGCKMAVTKLRLSRAVTE